MNGDVNTAQAVAPKTAEISIAHPRTAWPEYLLAFAATSIAVGIIWDISWHSTIGRDTFWTPAHMAIYLGGALGGSIGGWLAFKHTFLTGPADRNTTVGVLGARAPLGAWVLIWGAIAMLTSAPFDNWWHNAYGLDVKIISPPHILLGIGMFGICAGGLLLAVSRQNRDPGGPGAGIFIYVGGIFLVLGSIIVYEYTYPNMEHTASFFRVSAAMFAIRLVAMNRAARMSWPATRVALIYLLVECAMSWILPLFPAQPRLAPIYNPVTHMVPLAFPLLLVVPAFGMDLFLRYIPEGEDWLQRIGVALALGTIFMALFFVVQWHFAEFLLSPAANNWFFVGDRYWDYGAKLGPWVSQFFHQAGSGNPDPVTISSVVRSWVYACIGSWIGLIWGGWMRKVVR